MQPEGRRLDKLEIEYLGGADDFEVHVAALNRHMRTCFLVFYELCCHIARS